MSKPYGVYVATIVLLLFGGAVIGGISGFLGALNDWRRSHVFGLWVGLTMILGGGVLLIYGPDGARLMLK